MKAKKIMGIALLAFAIGQVSMAEKTDPNIERLLKIAKQKKAAEEKEARKQELLNSVTEEGETVPVTVIAPSKTAPKTNEKLEAKKNKEAEKKAARTPKKVEKAEKVKAEKTAPVEVVEVEEEVVEEEVKPRTPMEKLEYNANKAAIKVDFYERVVRSVAREEKELDGYNEVLGKKKPAKVKQQKAEKPAKTKKK